MGTRTEEWLIPQWDLADRLAKSLRNVGISVQEMADYLDVHRNSVGAWMNGRTPPGTRTLRLWAIRTGVPYEWLRNGVTPSPPPSPDDNTDPTAGAPSRTRTYDLRIIRPKLAA